MSISAHAPKSPFRLAVAATVVGIAALCLPARALAATEIVSRSSAGVLGDNSSTATSISADGRYVLVLSSATNLVDGDTNLRQDLFVRDRAAGTTVLVSDGAGGVFGNNAAIAGRISAGGRFVAFSSFATNLVEGDTNNSTDVFLRDRARGTIRRVSVGPGGAQADRGSSPAGVTPDGRYTLFSSSATNLVAGDENGFDDVFVHDRATRTTTRISRGPRGRWADGSSTAWSISPSGRFVSFTSAATNLVRGDVNGMVDCFVHDRATGRTVIASRSSAGVLGNIWSGGGCFVSANGVWVAFGSEATNLVEGDSNAYGDAFLRNLASGRTIRVSETAARGAGNGRTTVKGLSASGRFVLMESEASNLVEGDTNAARDVFVFDRRTRAIVRANTGSAGEQTTFPSTAEAISADGRFAAFSTSDPSIVPDDTNSRSDAFVAGPLR